MYSLRIQGRGGEGKSEEVAECLGVRDILLFGSRRLNTKRRKGLANGGARRICPPTLSGWTGKSN